MKDIPMKHIVEEEAHLLFHKLWTKAGNHPDYDKKEWMRLQNLLSLLDVKL